MAITSVFVSISVILFVQVSVNEMSDVMNASVSTTETRHLFISENVYYHPHVMSIRPYCLQSIIA